MVSKPSVAKYKYNLDSVLESSRQLATSGGREIVGVLLTAEGGAASALVCDSSAGPGDEKEQIAISANAGESSSFTPTQPVPFNKGLYVSIDQGQAFGAKLFVVYN